MLVLLQDHLARSVADHGHLSKTEATETRPLITAVSNGVSLSALMAVSRGRDWLIIRTSLHNLSYVAMDAGDVETRVPSWSCSKAAQLDLVKPGPCAALLWSFRLWLVPEDACSPLHMLLMIQ